jgi:hypothetical protein
MFISRNWRRILRGLFAVVIAVGTGTLVAPDYIPTVWAHNIQETCAWLGTALGILNPFLDLNADDAKGDSSKSAA